MSRIDKKFLKRYYEKEALAGHHQKRMYEPWLDPWNFLFLHEPRLSETMNWLTKANSMLDIGCAEGLYIELFLEKSKQKTGLSAAGVDISSEYIHKAKNAESNGHYCVADASALPFQDNSFDICICSEVLEHLVDAEKAFSEALRVSNKYLIVTTPGNTIFHSLALKIGVLRPQFRINNLDGPYKGHITSIDFNLMTKWARKHGSKIAYSRIGCFIPPMFFDLFKVPFSLAPIFARIDNFLSRIRVLKQNGLLQIIVVRKKHHQLDTSKLGKAMPIA